MELDIEDKKKPIKVYARVRPLNDEEVERDEKTSVETFDDEKRIKIIDEKHSQETTYHFDGVFKGTDSNGKVFHYTTKHLLEKLLNGINCAVLTYGQTGSGKTYTLMADGCITDYAIKELYAKIAADQIHKYTITCSFVQVYLEKVFDLLSSNNKEELPVREHPKKGIYVANLTHHQANTAEEVFALLERGKIELVTAETKMVRQSSRSHSIFQLSIERRLDVAKKKLSMANAEFGGVSTPTVPLCVPEGIMVLEEDMVLRGKMDICDLAGSERLGKTMVEGINRREARYINSSLLELGNVIYALSEGKRRHIPFRNSTLTRLLQECLGSRCQTSFIVCIAPSASEAYETRCSLNFGTRARTITNKERMSMNVEVDYKLLAKKLSKKIEVLEHELNASRPIRDFISSSLQNLNNTTVETQTDTMSLEQQWKYLSTDDSSSVKAPSVDAVKYTLGISEMLELLLENNENLNQQSNNLDTLRSSATMAIFTMATEKISMIHNDISAKIDIDKTFHPSNDIIEFISHCLQKMENVTKEMLVINRSDKNDLFTETAYTISEACSDIENILGQFLQSQTGIMEYLEHNYTESDVSSLYKMMHYALGMLGICQIDKDQSRNICYLYYLLNLLQVLQIARLLLESSKSIPHEQGPSKPFTWSTSVEEGTSSDVENSSNEDAYFSDISSMAGSGKRCEQGNGNPRTKEIEFIRNQLDEKQRINPPLQVKLNRSHSFKVKGEMLWGGSYPKDVDMMTIQSESESTDQSIPKLARRKSKVQSLDYPKTQTKRFVFIDDSSTRSLCSDGTEVEICQTKAELIDLEKRHDELSKKYKNVIEEKETLSEKLQKLQQDKMNLMTERDYAKQQFETVLNQREEEEEMFGKMRKENTILYSQLNKKEENSFEKEEVLIHLESSIKEKEELIKMLEFENKKLLKERDERTKESENKVIDSDETMRLQIKNEDDEKLRSDDLEFFAEEISSLCSVLDIVKHDDSIRRHIGNIEDITSLESELFNMIENNVKFEAALLDIQFKVNQILINNGGQDKCRDLDDCTKSQKKSVSAKVITTRLPLHVTKKINSMKKAQKKRVGDLRKTYSDQPVSSAKEIKACKATRVKELLQEKMKMHDHIGKLEKDLNVKEIELRESKKQIQLLVQELGQLDLELNKQNSPLSLSRQNSTLTKQNLCKGNDKCIDITLPIGDDEDIEIIEIPEIQYDDLIDIVNNQKNTKMSACDHVMLETVAEEEEMVPIKELGLMNVELGAYKRKYKDIEALYTNLKENGEQSELVSENLSLQRKSEYLDETNSALIEEIKLIKSTNHDRKLKVQELRERNNNLIHELEQYKRQSTQAQAKSDTTKQRLEKRLAKLKEKVSTLENELHLVKQNNSYNKSFNDSGLAQEDSDYLINSY